MNTSTIHLVIRAICFVLLLAIAHTSRAQFDEQPETVSLFEAALRGPAVASVLEMPRETPAQQLSAVFLLLDLGQDDVAGVLWKEISGDALDEEEQAALVRELGTARLLKLARLGEDSGLAGAREFAEGCLQAAATVNSDPGRLTELITALDEESAAVRGAARTDLAVTGDVGATVCLDALAQADNERLRTELLLTLAKMRPAVEPMLIAAIADGRGQFRRDVIELAGHLHLQDAVPWLAAVAAGGESDPQVVAASHAALSKMGLSSPSPADARAVVLNEIHQLGSHDQPPAANTPWWSYDGEQQKLSGRDVTASENQLLNTARLARMLGQLPGATPADRRLSLLYAYQVAEATGQPLAVADAQWAAALGVVEIGNMLHEALENNQISAAIACANLLADRGEPAALQSMGGQRGPLARALVHPDRELRFAALAAVMKIAPTQSFAGASGVSQALWYFAAGAGAPQAVAASSNISRASDWAGQLRGLGYDAAPVTTGREALLTALNLPRLELLLVDSDIGRPLLREVIFGVRSQPRLARVPVAVLSSLDNLARAEQIAATDAWLLATPRSQGNEAMEYVVAQLDQKRARNLTMQRRTEQAVAALGWIASSLENGHPYDELLRESKLVSETLYQPDLYEASLRVLSVLGTADSQQLLVDYVSTPTLPIEARRAGADAFLESVSRFGKLLTSAEILRQYDRYNSSETADRETQKVLGDVLDVLEK